MHPDRILLGGRPRYVCGIADVLGTCHDRRDKFPYDIHSRLPRRIFPSGLNGETTPFPSNFNKLSCKIPNSYGKYFSDVQQIGPLSLSTYLILSCQAHAWRLGGSNLPRLEWGDAYSRFCPRIASPMPLQHWGIIGIRRNSCQACVLAQDSFQCQCTRILTRFVLLLPTRSTSR